jgi:hypothetical protein
MVAAYRADLLASRHPTTPAAVAQGHDVALIVALCVVAAVMVRAALLWLDPRLARVRLEPATKRRLLAAGTAIVVVAGIYTLAGTDLTTSLEAQAKRFTRSDVAQTGDQRDRLTNPGINRLDHWNIDLNGFNAQPLRGQGAGTFALLWNRQRPTDSNSQEGHSLYLETMGELGLVGIVMLAAALLALLWGVVRRVRGPNRPLYAAVLVAALVWALHAGIDWDWEVPAITLWLFALAGQAGAAAPAWTPASGESPGSVRATRPLIRALLVAGCLALAVTPTLVAISQARLTQSVKAYRSGNCARAKERALASIDALGNRPEPFGVIGYCDLQSGSIREAENAMRAAAKRDPANWEYRYGLAIVRATAGRDPRRDARAALRLNPNEARARDLVARLRTSTNPRAWRAAVRQLGLRAGPKG